MFENYIAVYLLDVGSLIFLCFLIHNNIIMSQSRKWPFYSGTILTILIILSEIGTIIAEGRPELRSVNMCFNFFGFALTPIIPIVLIAIFDYRILQSNKFLLLPSVFNLIAAALTPRFGLVFSIDHLNHYQRGSYFIIFVASYFLNLFVLLIYTAKIGQKHHYPINMKLIALTLFVVMGTSIQLMFPTVYSTWHCVTLALLLYYLLLTEFDASLDALTKLHNRASFEKVVNKLSCKNPYSVVVMDINDFKEINDTYGHDFGDNVLKTIASVVRKSFDCRCQCFRVGGDEFYIINSETDPIKLEHQLRSMTNNLDQERRSESRLPTVAYGYGFFKGNKPMDFQKVLKEADEQMYFFKKAQKEKQKPAGIK